MKQQAIFVTGTGTGIGKTIVSAILVEALGADYWKPIQSGFTDETDRQCVHKLVSNKQSYFHQESYALVTPASPHLAAAIDNVVIEINLIKKKFDTIGKPDKFLIVEGAGGLMVPLNSNENFIDLIRALNIPVIAVANQYLGSINHALLTSLALEVNKIPVLGWIFNGNYLTNEDDILQRSPFPKIGRIEMEEEVDKGMIKKYAAKLKPALEMVLQEAGNL